MKKIVQVLLLTLSVCSVVYAVDHQEMPKVVDSPEFARIKDLAGIWQGSTKMGKEKVDATVIYQITSGGRAVTETLFPGTPHEMVSVYYDEGGKLTMTHYCMLPNRPVMQVQKVTPKKMDLVVMPGGSVGPKDHHMHSLSIAWKSPDQITQTWVSMKDDKSEKSEVIQLKRAK